MGMVLFTLKNKMEYVNPPGYRQIYILIKYKAQVILISRTNNLVRFNCHNLHP